MGSVMEQILHEIGDKSSEGDIMGLTLREELNSCLGIAEATNNRELVSLLCMALDDDEAAQHGCAALIEERKAFQGWCRDAIPAWADPQRILILCGVEAVEFEANALGFLIQFVQTHIADAMWEVQAGDARRALRNLQDLDKLHKFCCED